MKRTRKRWLGILLTCCLLLSLTVPARAATASGTCGDNLTWTVDSGGTLTISGTGAMTDYDNSSNSAPWHFFKRLEIGNGVTSIGDYAFYNCSSLTSIDIPDSVISIGDSAFESCKSLALVTIGNGVTSIGKSAFKFCEFLSLVTMGNRVTSIGDYAFSNCKLLTSITIPNSVTSIGEHAFNGCGLTSIDISNNITEIGAEAFAGCGKLQSIAVASGSSSFTAVDGVLFNAEKTRLLQYPAGKSDTTYMIPNSVTSISDSAFDGCDSLTSVTIPNGVTSIGDSAFTDCISLTSVTIPNNVTSIGDSAFYYCKSLTHITIGNSVTFIGAYAFYECSSLTSVTIPNSVTSIGDSAFEDCDLLTSITVPDNVTSIGSYAFYDCDLLTNITIGNSVISIGLGAFYSCNLLTSVIIPNNVRLIDAKTFYDCSSLTSVTIPFSVTSIGNSAFFDCTALTDVYYGGNESQWKAISIGRSNDRLFAANIHYNTDTGNTTPVTPTSKFTDVASTSPYADAIAWAVEKGITAGYSDGTFRPDNTCTVAQILTFLWRAKGSVQSSAQCPFPYIGTLNIYYTPLCWAGEAGILQEGDADDYRDDCTRALAVTFLWRASGSIPNSGDTGFSDVPSSASYAQAVLWAIARGVTNGYADGMFHPDRTCTRGQIVTFLYRAYA